jgi:hypothetical protein
MSNIFGGKNKNSLYIPMSEIEQEFISRLADKNEFYILIHEWGYVDNPTLVFGDKNLHFGFKMFFDRPETPMPVHFFDMELRTRSGMSLFRQKMSLGYGGQPMIIMQGLELEMVWDIALKNIDPKIIKQLMPNTVGLTSRLQDTTTGEITLLGNMNLNREARDLAHKLDQAEKALPILEQKYRAEDRKKAQEKKQS